MVSPVGWCEVRTFPPEDNKGHQEAVGTPVHAVVLTNLRL